jgi:ribonucleoside-triphosphate reductase (thioredoxin)
MTNLPTIYQQVIHKSKYARYLEEENRREEWGETVDRLIQYLISILPENKPELVGDLVSIREAIINLEVMPSMRLLMTAGEAVRRDNIAAYNCAYVAANSKRAFSEALHILMNGTGVGFSCERDEINQLPPIPDEFKESEDVIVVGDSKLGWSKAYKKLLSSLWEGDIPKIDYSKVRGAGERLKTFGGRASGHEPLRRLFDFVTTTFKEAKGQKLNSLQVHDIMCMTGEVVVVGGVRRSALISLSNLTDTRMRHAKDNLFFQDVDGSWKSKAPHRALSNNSVSYTQHPDMETFMEEWTSLVKSKSGERGIFNRVAAQKQAARWGRRKENLNYGCNPCSEIILRDKQFCNLTEVVVRSSDTFEDLARKVKLATILGTIQSSLTNFLFLSEEWKKNTEEERLLGVSLTGIMDNSFMTGIGVEDAGISATFGHEDWTLEQVLDELRNIARETNEEFSKQLGITPSVAITCVKPSGTVSQLVDSASGIHSRHSPYYIRRLRMDKKDPICDFLISKGVPVEDCISQPANTYIFSFPQKAPTGAVVGDSRSALEQLELWLIYQRYWCEHKPSCTVRVRDEEWLEVGAWVWKHFDEISGISFLPYSNHTYQQAPYEEITKEQYEELIKNSETYQNLNWKEMQEEVDNTVSSQELACVGGACEI